MNSYLQHRISSCNGEVLGVLIFIGMPRTTVLGICEEDEMTKASLVQHSRCGYMKMKYQDDSCVIMKVSVPHLQGSLSMIPT